MSKSYMKSKYLLSTVIALYFVFLGICFFTFKSSAATVESVKILSDRGVEKETQKLQIMSEDEAKNYSTNVSVETDKTSYNCAEGQKFSFKLKITTEEPYLEGEHKYIGYLAVLDGGWQQIKSWYIDGGILEYTITLNSSDYVREDKRTFTFTASVFPVDDFTEGASLCDNMFMVRFLDPSFTVSYDANGGQCDIGSGSIIYNLEYGELPVPIRTGYTFDGWYTSVSGGVKITEDTIVTTTQDQTLYAHWKANIYTIILNANGGKCSPLSIPGIYGSSYDGLADVSVTAPTGYVFDGWYTSAVGGTKISTSSKITIAASHTLYAHWTQKEYTIRYDANGGTGAPASQIKYYDETLVLSWEVPIRNGYIFLGWNTWASSTIPSFYAGDDFTWNDDVVLYAIWQPEDKAGTGGTTSPDDLWQTGNNSFQNNEQTFVNDWWNGKELCFVEYNFTYGSSHISHGKTCWIGDVLTIPPAPEERFGYRFLGWRNTYGGKNKLYEPGDNITLTEPLSLTAEWQNMQTLPTIKILKVKKLKGTVEIKFKTSKKVDGYDIYFSNTKTFNNQLSTRVKTWKKGVLRPKRKAYKRLKKKLKKVKYVKIIGYKKKKGLTYFTKTTNKSLKKIK